MNGTLSDAVVLLSGGIDSAACAYFLLSQRHNVRGVFVDFSQAAAAQERRAVALIAERLGICLQDVSLQLGKQFDSGEIPGRNAALVFVGLLAIPPRSPGCIGLGIHAGSPYFDCS